jgi:hypothetical protein
VSVVQGEFFNEIVEASAMLRLEESHADAEIEEHDLGGAPLDEAG